MANSIFPAGSELDINIGWVSGNGQTILRLQQDRNLVLYKNNSPAYQAPNAYGNGNIAIMQDDGNFVLYDQNNGPVWASNTAGNRCQRQQAIGDQLAKMLLAGEVHDGDVVPVNVSADGDALVLG